MSSAVPPPPIMPDIPAIPRDLVDFEAGEAVGEQAGARAERGDVLAYLARKQANAERIVERNMDADDYAAHTARALSVLIGDLAGGLHEGEALIAPAGTAICEPYTFRDHRTMADVREEESGAALGAISRKGEV